MEQCVGEQETMARLLSLVSWRCTTSAQAAADAQSCSNKWVAG
jgi:hypothetical protein